jgi:UDP-glucose 4-epimerase
VFGPNVDNYIVRAWTKQPFFAEIGGSDVPVQYVHEDDVVDALIGLLDGRHAGAFNLAGDGTMTWGECADLIGTPRRRLPKKLFWRFAGLMWKLRQAESPPGNLHFLLHPWVVSTDRLKQATGWSPRYTSRATFEITMRAHGKLPPSDDTPVEKPELAAPVGA